MTGKAERRRVEEELRRRLQKISPTVLHKHPLESHAEALEQEERPGLYQHVPDLCRRACREIVESHGEEALDRYHRLLLVWLAIRSTPRLSSGEFPESIRALTERFQERIVARAATGRPGYYVHRNDRFSKDLGVCRLRLLPCGPELLDRHAALPRSNLTRGGVRQFLSGAWLALRAGGFGSFYTLHLDRRLVADFNEEGYDRCYLRIAELLERDPDAKGLACPSWWYDPAIESVSPELSFLRHRPGANGARFLYFDTGTDVVNDATKLSRERRDRYEKGQYLPKRYTLVWLRDDLLRWARRHTGA